MIGRFRQEGPRGGVRDLPGENAAGIDLAGHEHAADALFLEERDQAAELAPREPIERLGPGADFPARLAAQGGDDAGKSLLVGFSQRQEREGSRPGDQSDPLSHFSAVFLTRPRLEAAMKARISSRSSPAGHSARMASTAWVILRPP